ncbi:uncharacterized protein B0H18DRAFT_89134 [Fomitopsis serialis]|uniref:uncharacterized protein n=1 Tax=Fomitopsis serialis TaxID=139415 RepID=UPI0020085EB2|nr:uncharacterized protein B0H18DRAFT_89134 [Neoantrodia serialis]KAH9931601.1 hypothetical protein B0H18DRAFT_89134 [Neoantrodia serialis]
MRCSPSRAPPERDIWCRRQTGTVPSAQPRAEQRRSKTYHSSTRQTSRVHSARPRKTLPPRVGFPTSHPDAFRGRSPERDLRQLSTACGGMCSSWTCQRGRRIGCRTASRIVVVGNALLRRSPTRCRIVHGAARRGATHRTDTVAPAQQRGDEDKWKTHRLHKSLQRGRRAGCKLSCTKAS